jgi:hypothetical protein
MERHLANRPDQGRLKTRKMRRKNNSFVKETKFDYVDEIVVNGRTVAKGEIIKIDGEHGGRFKFNSLVTNRETGAQWIDCFEMQKGIVSAWRSFKSDRIKLIPIKRGRKNVNRSKPN